MRALLERFVIEVGTPHGTLRAPFAVTWRGRVFGCGTDGFRLLAIEGEEATGLPPVASGTQERIAQLLEVMVSEAARRATIDLAALAAFAGAPPAPVVVCPKCDGDGRITCDECDGSGESECECLSCGHEHEADCEACHGDGHVRCACRGHREMRREYALVDDLLLDCGGLASALEDAELLTGTADLVLARTAEPSPVYVVAPSVAAPSRILLVMPVRREAGLHPLRSFPLPSAVEVAADA